MVSTLLVQKRKKSNMASESVAYWDEKTDGYVTHTFEAKSFFFNVHVFAAAI